MVVSEDMDGYWLYLINMRGFDWDFYNRLNVIRNVECVCIYFNDWIYVYLVWKMVLNCDVIDFLGFFRDWVNDVFVF